jgi:hypothetical protein
MGFMPTLGRPPLVEESIRMWELQTYPDRELLVLDTANQMSECSGETWRIVHQGDCPYSMGTTCNVGIRMSDAEAICRWDDDDSYAPWHLEAMGEALQSHPWACPYSVWDCQFGPMKLCRTYRDTRGPRDVAYAGTWAFTRVAFEAVGGYRETMVKEQELEFRNRLFARYGPPGDSTAGRFPAPSYSYAINQDRVPHYGHMTDEQRQSHQRQAWPAWPKVTPRWPRNYMLGYPLDPKIEARRF